jgi:hypothetical protein
MTPTKIGPTRSVKKFERYNCTGKLRVKVDFEDDVMEVIVLPKGGGCETNLKCIAALIVAMEESNIDRGFIISTLRKIKPCGSPIKRMQRENLPREQVGMGGCPQIIADAIEEGIKKQEEKAKASLQAGK